MSTAALNKTATAAYAPVVLGEDVSIATAAHGNVQTTRHCLDALFQSAAGSYELILIDDCSPDAGAIRSLFSAAKQHHVNTRLFSFTENLEYSGSLRAILSHARGQWVLFISNDIFVTPIYVRMLLDVAKANPRIGIVRGSSNFVDNGLPSHNLSAPAITTLQGLFQAGGEIAAAHGGAWQPDQFLVGDAFLVTRAVIDRIGTFDSRFFGYFADGDYGLRAQIAGFELALVRGAFAYHRRDANFDYLPEELRQAKLSRRWMRVFENWARFKLKYDLPVPMDYPAIDKVPWTQLASVPFDKGRHFSELGDYSRYITVR
jgi:GT2 family glycosyltransferase